MNKLDQQEEIFWNLKAIGSLKKRAKPAKIMNRSIGDGKEYYLYIRDFYENNSLDYLYQELKSKQSILFLTGNRDYDISQLAYLEINCKYLKRCNYDDENIAIYNYLIKNGIKYCYHITPYKNCENIIKYGIHSNLYLKKYNINHNEGGNEISLYLDKINGLNKNVHLSFCRNTPMLYRLLEESKYVAIFIIPINIVLFSNILFSYGNASSKTALFFDNLEDLKKILNKDRISKINQINNGNLKYIYKGSEEFVLKQSELLVDTVPLWYLENFYPIVNDKYCNNVIKLNQIEEMEKQIDYYLFDEYWHAVVISK